MSNNSLTQQEVILGQQQCNIAKMAADEAFQSVIVRITRLRSNLKKGNNSDSEVMGIHSRIFKLEGMLRATRHAQTLIASSHSLLDKGHLFVGEAIEQCEIADNIIKMVFDAMTLIIISKSNF